jgi:Fe-S cluster assembly protein SufD
MVAEALAQELTLTAADFGADSLRVEPTANEFDLYIKLDDAGRGPANLELSIQPRARVRVFCSLTGAADELSSRFNLGTGSRLDFFSLVEDTNARLAVEATLAKKAEANFTGLTRVEKEEKAAVEVHVRHTEGQNLSWQKFYSYADDNSAVAFTGRITVDAGAGGAVAHQLHRGITLCEGARIDARPFLNIMHDDVKCTHGSTVGFVDEDARRYLMARGISAPDAEKVLILSSQKQFYDALPHAQAEAFFSYTGDAP